MANYFVAFPLSNTKVLPATMPDTLRSFVVEDLHCTLAFLGNMNPDLAETIIDALPSVVSPQIHVRLDHLRMLPSTQKCSAVSWVLGEGRLAVESLMTNYRDRFYSLAHAKPDAREALAHVTIARPKSKLNEIQRAELSEWTHLQPAPSEQLCIDRVALYTWAEDRQIRQFRIVAEHLLKH